jgi:hypothetical protein
MWRTFEQCTLFPWMQYELHAVMTHDALCVLLRGQLANVVHGELGVVGDLAGDLLVV